MNAGSSVLLASLLPWPRATPSWCFLLPKETERNCGELSHKCRRNAFLTDISRLFHNRQTTSHMQSLAEKQKVQVWIVCVY